MKLFKLEDSQVFAMDCMDGNQFTIQWDFTENDIYLFKKKIIKN